MRNAQYNDRSYCFSIQGVLKLAKATCLFAKGLWRLDIMNHRKLVDVCKDSAEADTKKQAYGQVHFEECPNETYNHKPNKEESVAMLSACLQGYHEVIWKVVTESSLQKRNCRPTCVRPERKLKLARVSFHIVGNRRIRVWTF